MRRRALACTSTTPERRSVSVVSFAATQQPRQVYAQFAGRLISTLGIAIQRFQDHGLEGRSDFGIDECWPDWVIVQDGVDQQRRLAVRVSALAARHLVKHGPGRPDVRPRVACLGAQQLGSHVRQGATHGRADIQGRGFGVFVERLQSLGEAEVQNFELAVRIDADVAWLQIAVDNFFAVRRFQSASQLNPQFQRQFLRHRLMADLLVEVDAGNIFGDQVIDTVLFSEVEGHGEIRMVQLADRQGFAAELRAASFVAKQLVGKDFKRYVAVQLLVEGAEDHAHASSADLLDQPVVPEDLAVAERERRHCPDIRAWAWAGQ